MANKKLRFKCDICKKVLVVNFDDDFQANFKKEANKMPYPVIYPHEDHWAVIYLDGDYRERGIICSKILLKDKK
jgi:hypothetical protein